MRLRRPDAAGGSSAIHAWKQTVHAESSSSSVFCFFRLSSFSFSSSSAVRACFDICVASRIESASCCGRRCVVGEGGRALEVLSSAVSLF